MPPVSQHAIAEAERRWEMWAKATDVKYKGLVEMIQPPCRFKPRWWGGGGGGGGNIWRAIGGAQPRAVNVLSMESDDDHCLPCSGGRAGVGKTAVSVAQWR